MIDIVKRHIEGNDSDNQIYFALNIDEIIEVKQELKKEHNYLDIVLDFKDAFKLKELINSVPDCLNKATIINYIYENYICYKILKESGLEVKPISISVKEIENILFSGDYEKFRDMEFIIYLFVEDALKKYQKINNKKVRIHIFFDEVEEVYLQEKINDLIFTRQPVIFMGYTSQEKLICYNTTSGSYIESPHDYSSHYPGGYFIKTKKFEI